MAKRRKHAGRIEASKSTPNTLRICGASERCELQAAEAGADGKPKLRRFSMVAYTGGQMTLEGFFFPVVVDLAGVKASRQDMPIFLHHDPLNIVGHTDEVEILASKIKETGVISGVGDAAQEVLATASNGFPWQASIGASVERREFIEAGQSVKVNGRNFNGPLYVVRASTLTETSFVPIGADTGTSANVAAKGNLGDLDMTFEQWLEANGFDGATLSAKQRETLTAAWKKAETPAPTPPAPAPAPAPAVKGSLADIIEASKKDAERQSKIRELVTTHLQARPAPHMIDLIAKVGEMAIEQNWEVDKADLELMRITRNTVNATNRSNDDGLNEDVLEAAVCMSAKLPDPEKHFKEQTLEAAHKRYRGGIGLAEFLLICAKRNAGVSEVALRTGNLRKVLQAAFQQSIRAGIGQSTLDTSGILSNTANKFLRVGFDAIESTWRAITAVKSVKDFKTITSYTLTGDMQYEKVAAGGELKHGTLGEQSYTNRADTYGKILGLDRRDMINDDLGAFSSANTRLGRGGALKINDVFWTEFLSNSSFFTTGRGNYATGSGTAFGADGLVALELLFKLLTDPDSKPLGIDPKILLVPPAHRFLAKRLMASINQNKDSLDGEMNPLAGMFSVESSTYMANSNYTGYSSVAYYLLADPNELPVIETVFLNGVETPTVETAEYEANRLGIALRAYHDFGCAKQEYRGGCKHKGEA